MVGRTIQLPIAGVWALAFVLGLAALTGLSPAMAAPATVLVDPAQNPPPQSESFRHGVEAYDKGDFAGAYAIWLPLAQKSDLAAMRNVALMLREGKGVKRDPARALWFYEEAGSKGFGLAQVNAAFMHLEGDGVPKNLEAAAFWFHTAAVSGSPIAQYNLAVLYERGTGVDKDIAKALGWYALAARSGSQLALDRLAILVPALKGPKAPERSALPPEDADATKPAETLPSDLRVTNTDGEPAKASQP